MTSSCKKQDGALNVHSATANEAPSSTASAGHPQTPSEDVRYLVCGAIAGAVSRTATAPLDRLKVFLQTRSVSSHGNKPTSILYGLREYLLKHGGGGPPLVNPKLQGTPHKKTLPVAVLLAKRLWRGNGINIAKIVPEYAIRFTVFEHLKISLLKNGNQAPANIVSKETKDPRLKDKNFVSVLSNPDDQHCGYSSFRILGPALCGAVAGLVAQIIVYPLETWKTRAMSGAVRTSRAIKPADTVKGAASSSAPSVVNIINNVSKSNKAFIRSRISGMRRWYRGLLVSVLGIIPYAGIELGLYDVFRKTGSEWLRQRELDKHVRLEGKNQHGCGDGCGGEIATSRFAVAVPLAAGSVASAVAACAVYPLSLVRTRLQAQGTPAHPKEYAGGMRQVMRGLVADARSRGFGIFYRGLTPTLLKVVPAAGINYFVYEQMKSATSTFF